MGDRATIHFGTTPEDIAAAIHLHWAGDVEAMLAAFLDDEADAIRRGYRDNRGSDPATLAARCVVWHDAMRGHHGVSIVPPRSMNGTDYLVQCNSTDRPTVTRLAP